MKNTKILEMLNNGKIEELKCILEDEIYNDNLKGNGTATKRYTAMKRYFKNVKNDSRKFMNYPGTNISVDGVSYNAFCDSFCITLTTESVGQMETTDDYLNIEPMFNISNYKTATASVDLNKVLAEAKAKGYKYKVSEIGNNPNFTYAFKFKDGFYKIGLLDKAFSIINDGEKAEVTYLGTKKAPLYISTSLGKVLLLPFNAEADVMEKKIVIDVNKILDAVA